MLDLVHRLFRIEYLVYSLLSGDVDTSPLEGGIEFWFLGHGGAHRAFYYSPFALALYGSFMVLRCS